MSAIQFKPEPGSDKGEIRRSWLGRATEPKSPGARLVELGRAIAGAEFRTGTPGVCSHCRSGLNLRDSSAEYPNVFCSEQCEQEFIRAALASLTVEDCIRMHRRLENLLVCAPEPSFESSDEERPGAPPHDNTC